MGTEGGKSNSPGRLRRGPGSLCSGNSRSRETDPRVVSGGGLRTHVASDEPGAAIVRRGDGEQAGLHWHSAFGCCQATPIEKLK